MAKHGIALQSFSTELIQCLDNLRTKRDEIQAIIELEELEKARLQAEIESLSNRLSAILTSLTKKTAARADFDRAIAESETALCRLLENSQAVVNNVRREISTLSGDEIMKTAAVCPQGAHLCLIETEKPPPPPVCVPQCPPTSGAGIAMALCKSAANGL